jgi:cyclopropane fatty-acyl-phospholipid synthase-like methyltransferase
MLEAILQEFHRSTYDFRPIAHPADPLRDRFAAWIDYYRLKWAIARVLQPQSILEIGVRYGYSAHAFLDAVPQSRYVGIDLDCTAAGGVKGAIDWAKQILAPFQTELIVADSQAMSRFPGDRYDLIHIDGQQDGDSSFHDLQLAIDQADYVLVDGYHWSAMNYLAVNDWLLQHRDRLAWYGTIPGYAGELLIKVNRAALMPIATSSLELRHTYDHAYYTQSCQGYDAYASYQGRRLCDERLQAVATIASLKSTGRVLDLGCGRGELAYYFAQQGFEVTAIDYSPAAISLAQQCFQGEPALQQRVQWICGDVNQVELAHGQYDLAIATDLIEHLAPAELDQLYQRIQHWLKPDGLLIIHTFPNRWYYQYDYARKRRQAKALGAYLPQQPRSRDEQRMHINEQSPRVLQRQLRSTFEQVLVWFSGAGANSVGGSLVQPLSRRALAAAPSLYAIASRQCWRAPLLDRLRSQPLPLQRRPWGAGLRADQLRLWILNAPRQVLPGTTFEISVQLENYSTYQLHSNGTYPIYWAFRWYDQSGAVVLDNGQRTRLVPPARPPARPPAPQRRSDSSQSYFVKIVAPTTPGFGNLRVTLVQEGVRWLDQAPLYVFQDTSIVISEAASRD